MNATPPISQAPRGSDAAQANAPASAAGRTSQGGSRDFAAALSDAGPKPVRKHGSNKHHEASRSGNDLPASGNQPPSALGPPPPARTEVPAGQDKDAAGTAPVSQAGSAAADANSTPAATVAGDPAAAPKDAGDPVLASDAAAALLAADPKTPPAAAVAATTTASAAATTSTAADSATTTPEAPEAPGAVGAVPPDATAAAPALAKAASGSAPPAGPTMPHAASIRSLQTADVQGRVAPRDTAQSNAATAAANSPAANDQAQSNGPATADSNAAAQAVMAAAAAQSSVPPNSASSSADDTITPDGGISLQGMVAANDAPFAAPTADHAPAGPSAIAAASAAAVVQAAQGAADAGAADRHSRGNSADSSPSASANDGTAGAAQLLTSNAPTDAAPMPTFKVPAGVDTADFGQGVADRVSLMMDGNLSTAKLQVNPPALGPIEVRIALQAGHAQVWLSSHSAVTRDALESSAPKLREMLGSQGFAQVSVDISQRSFQERSPQSHAYEASPSIGDSPAVLPVSAAVSRAASGLLDAYA